MHVEAFNTQAQFNDAIVDKAKAGKVTMEVGGKWNETGNESINESTTE